MWTTTNSLAAISISVAVIGLLTAHVIAAVKYGVKQVWRADALTAAFTALTAEVQALANSKVSVTDCLRSHGETVTKPFCEAQHARANAGLEKLSEEFGGLAVEVRGIGKDVEWLKDGVRALHGGVTLANPHPPPLPPDPREQTDEEA